MTSFNAQRNQIVFNLLVKKALEGSLEKYQQQQKAKDKGIDIYK